MSNSIAIQNILFSDKTKNILFTYSSRCNRDISLKNIDYEIKL